MVAASHPLIFGGKVTQRLRHHRIARSVGHPLQFVRVRSGGSDTHALHNAQGANVVA